MILVIDNYDSFTYNLVQLIGEMGAEVDVRRNDELTVDAVAALLPSHIIISSGPGTPNDAGISKDVILNAYETIPILGVCLGHQCIGDVFGGRVVRARFPMHGKTSFIQHGGQNLFQNLPNPFVATRYHSLILDGPLPDVLEITARTADGEIMGLRHKRYPVEGVQFHPESILTSHGKVILKNFLEAKR